MHPAARRLLSARCAIGALPLFRLSVVSGSCLVGALRRSGRLRIGCRRDGTHIVRRRRTRRRHIGRIRRAIRRRRILAGAGRRLVRARARCRRRVRDNRKRAAHLGNLVVIEARVRASFYGEGVVGGANRRLLARKVVAEALAFDERPSRHRCLVLGERDTVIHLGIRRGSYCHGTLGHDERGLPARHIGELGGDVLAGGILDHNGGSVDRGQKLAGVRDGALGRGLEREARRQTVDVDTSAGQRLAVVDLAAVARRDGDCHLARGDLEGTDGALHDVVVRFLSSAVPRDGVGIGARAHKRLAAGGGEAGGLAVHEARNLPRGRERRAVIGLRRAARGDSESRGVNHKAAVLHLEADVREVLAAVAEVARLEAHGVAARVGARYLRRARERDVARVEAGGGVGARGAADHIGDGIALDTVLRAVVGGGAAVPDDLDDDLLGVRGHLELAALRGHQVVVPARPLVEREDEGVVALADVGLRARDGDGHALAVDEADPLALGRDADGAVGERRAVVGFVRALGLQRDEALRDGDALGARRVLTDRVVGTRRAELNG